MTEQEAKKMQKELSDYKKVFSELEERCSPEALEYWHRHLWYGLTIQSNAEAAAPKEGEPPKQPLEQYPYWGNKDNGFNRQKI